MNRWYVLAIPLLALGSILGACGGSDSKTVDVPGGGKISVSDKLPSGFPDDFPVPKGAKTLGSYSGESQGQKGTVVSFQTDDSADDVKSFYEDEFGKGPWKNVGSSDASGTGTFLAEKDDMGAGVFISEVSGKTTFIVTYGSKEDLGIGSDSGNDDQSTPDDSSSADDKTASGDDNGSNDSSGSSDLPDEVDLEDAYPKDKIPLPSGARVTSSSAVTSSGSSFVSVELYSKKTVDELKDFYKDAMEKAGYTESVSSSSNGETFLSYTEGDGSSGNAAIVSITKSDVAGYNIVSISLTGTDSE